MKLMTYHDIFSANISLVPGTSCLAVQRATCASKLANPLHMWKPRVCCCTACIWKHCIGTFYNKDMSHNNSIQAHITIYFEPLQLCHHILSLLVNCHYDHFFFVHKIFSMPLKSYPCNNGRLLQAYNMYHYHRNTPCSKRSVPGEAWGNKAADNV